METDPAEIAADAGLVFIGRISSSWKERASCPKNMRAAREAGEPVSLKVDATYRRGLRGLEGCSHLIILSWLHYSPRNLIVQKPRHATEPKGVFALRSPVRPNPIGIHIAAMTSLDIEAGTVGLDAIDALDGTPLLDIKPYFASTDSIPDALRSTT